MPNRDGLIHHQQIGARHVDDTNTVPESRTNLFQSTSSDPTNERTDFVCGLFIQEKKKIFFVIIPKMQASFKPHPGK